MKYILSLFCGCTLTVAILLPVHSCRTDPTENRKDKTIQTVFEAQYQMIDHPMGTQEFNRILAPLVARVGCGHTSLWTPDGYWDKAPERMFPLGVHARDEELFVIHSFNRESPIAFGSRILSVNRQMVGDMLAEMLGNIWSDGFIMSKRLRRLNRIFPYLYALNYGYPGQFEMVLMEAGKKKKLTQDPVSIMTIRSFAYYDDNEGFNRFIDGSFQVIHDRNIRHLIIDLRGNDGGDPYCSSHLLGDMPC